MSNSILSKEEAERLAVDYTPRKFPATVSKTASAFVAFQAANAGDPSVSGFRLDKIVSQQTGVAELERLSIEEKVEREALSRLKDLQENAYQQAYQLGIEEGREKAYLEAQEHIKQSLSSLHALFSSVENLKSELVTFNETHIVRLCYYMARRLAMGEIAENRELVLNVVAQAIQSAQSEEEMTVRVSPADFQFIEQMKEKLPKEFEALKRAKLEASDEIHDGGCVVETNYGTVDATVEQRMDKLWDAIAGKLPKVKNETSS